MQSDWGTRILRVVRGRDARATSPNWTTTRIRVAICLTISTSGGVRRRFQITSLDEIHFHDPKRCRYSPDEMKALTISAAI